MLCESGAVRTDSVMCSQDYMKANVLVEFVSRWRLLGIDSNSIGELVWIPMILYWLDNYLVIKCIYEYILNR